MVVSYYWKVFKNISISFWRVDNVGMFVNNVRDIGQCRVIIIITIIIITLFPVMKSGAPLLGLAKYIYYCSMGKLYQTLVRKSLMGILFNFVLSNTLHTRNTHVLQLSADHQVTALQVVRTSFQHSFISGLPRQSLLLFLTSHGIDPEYMSMIMCNLRGLNFLLCALEK